ncbi:hypothetical protein [Micromonospora lutea]|uniref:YtxH domain-containing protein n=1 Tax=Micromonospora lutea TaxID=419825 RepID=A0ABQ4IXM6_9ACTN|nr:hypothetical protein [Micromonospora lutea]GIJ22674.1 hypothetical protein Vlu01_32980 [Micromonospora lutea]
MARRRTPNTRPALVLAFAVGTLAGAAGALTLRRRGRHGASFADEITAFADGTSPAGFDERLDRAAPTPVGAPVAVEQG